MACPNSSFSRIPVSYAFNREQYDTIHRSTKIKEDVLLTFFALKDVKSYDFEYSKNKLQNIINVYNENAKYVNNSIKNESHFKERTYEQYCEDSWHRIKPSYSDYQHDESLRQHKLFKTMDEEAQISQLGYLFPPLAKKITRAAERLNARAPVDTLPFTFDLTKVENRYTHDLFAPKLRKIEVPVHPSPSERIEQISQNQVVTAALSLETPVQTVNSTPAPIIDVKVLVNLKHGLTLGICCDPNWAEQPISFTPCENGWKGQVPKTQAWKFVTLENGKVASWEKLKGNRYCDDKTQAFTVQANEVKF